MMRIEELAGAQLDLWAAKAEGLTNAFISPLKGGAVWNPDCDEAYTPSDDWAQGGPIIERERILVAPSKQGWGWQAYTNGYWINDGLQDFEVEQYGETILEAAMRAYVASKFGEALDISIPSV